MLPRRALDGVTLASRRAWAADLDKGLVTQAERPLSPGSLRGPLCQAQVPIHSVLNAQDGKSHDDKRRLRLRQGGLRAQRNGWRFWLVDPKGPRTVMDLWREYVEQLDLDGDEDDPADEDES